MHGSPNNVGAGSEITSPVLPSGNDRIGDRLVLHTRVVTGTGGGPDKTILNSPRFLKDQGYPMICAFLRHPEDRLFSELARRAERWQAPILPVDDRGPLDLSVISRFREICQEHQPAIWHAHDYKSNVIGLVLRRKFPMRLITTVHGWVKHTWKTPLYYAIDKYCLRRYDEVICVSQDLYDECLALGVPKEHCWHVPNAIDTDEFSRRLSVAESKEKLGFPVPRFLIGAVGRLSAEKGFDLLIQAVGRLVTQGIDAELWIAGEGDAEPELQQLIDSLGLHDRVKLLGFRSDCTELYHAMDCFALSSLREGLPNVLLEAMALSVPVLCTNVAGIPKLITDGDNGLLVEPGSIDALENGLKRLQADSGLRSRLGGAARATIEAKYSFRRRMDKIKAIYDQSLARPEVRT